MNLPRPNETTFALMLLTDSTDPDQRALALLDVTGSVLEKWTPGNDLCIVIRRPTPSELAQMVVHDRDQ